jgi:RNA-directed DNA polymerase
MCCRKQWRRARTEVGDLLALAVDRRNAILTAISRRGYWHLARARWLHKSG